MNPESFGLNRPPFRVLRAYPGPQQLALAGSFKRSLTAPDSALAVTGPVGTGKTVSVRHALERLEGDKLVGRIGRTHLDRHEVLEQLLEEFGVDPIPASSLKRLAALHRVFGVANLGRHVFILVEDAERLGADVIAELESLTAADDGESAGAHLILLGPPTLEEFLKDPLLVRLNQRIRRRIELSPFSASETRGYIEHCLRSAGGTPDEIIDDEAIAIIHDCSSGVARLVNAIAEAMLFAASEQKAARIDRRLALRVARDEFGYITGSDDSDELTDVVQDDELPSAAASAVVTTGAGEMPDSPAEMPTAAADADSRFVTEPADDDVASTDSLTDSSTDSSDNIDDTRPELATISGIFSVPDASPTDAALRALRNATPPANRADAVTREEAGAAPGTVPEPVHPRPLSKSSDPSDTQTARALDDALRPDTQWFASLDDILDESSEQTESASPASTAASAQTVDEETARAAADTSMTGTVPALSEDLVTGLATTADALEDATGSVAQMPADTSMTGTVPALSEELMSELASSSGSAPVTDRSVEESPCDTSMTGTVPALSEELMSEVASTPASAEGRDADLGAKATADEPMPTGDASVSFEPSVDMAIDDDSADLPTLSLQDTISSPALDAVGGSTAADTLRPSSETQETAPSRADSPSAAAPAIADDDTALQKAAPDVALVPEITLDNELEQHQQQAQAKVQEEGARTFEAAAEASGTADESSDDTEEQKRRLKTLAQRFSQARSLEDVMDDTAAETLFGEEFSKIAASVTSLQEVLGDLPASDASPAAANSEAFSGTESTPTTPVTTPQAQAAVPPAAAPAETRAKAPSAPLPTKPDLDSSAARRLEMVRALNRKAGKKPPPMPPPLLGGPEEIVLGDGDSVDTKPEPIENQFGPSMTNTLRALSAENIRKMQEAEEAEKAGKKGGLLSRFRRS